jgi:D-alanine-D-alanine ligase
MQIAQMTKQIFAQIGANGMLRVDYLLDTASGKVYVNEINTLPGTIYNHLWEKTGIGATKVIEMMITHGQIRAQQFAQMSGEFNSSVLEDANNMKLRQ